MTLTLTIPDSVCAALNPGDGLERSVLEGFAVGSYRMGRLSLKEVRELLGHESRWETEEFLSAHEAWPAISQADVLEGQRNISRGAMK